MDPPLKIGCPSWLINEGSPNGISKTTSLVTTCANKAAKFSHKTCFLTHLLIDSTWASQVHTPYRILGQQKSHPKSSQFAAAKSYSNTNKAKRRATTEARPNKRRYESSFLRWQVVVGRLFFVQWSSCSDLGHSWKEHLNSANQQTAGSTRSDVLSPAFFNIVSVVFALFAATRAVVFNCEWNIPIIIGPGIASSNEPL